MLLVLASIGGLFLAPRTVIAQAKAEGQEIRPQVVLSKLFPPIYPPLARWARTSGDVHLKVSIHPDGSINTVTVIDGPPMLLQAALDSARQSHFDCERCGGSDLVERTFTYSFEIPEQKPADSSCCLEEQAPPDKAATARVCQSDDHITITVPPTCICSAEYLGTLMDRRMRLIAGNDALDCGRMKVDGDPKPGLRCARRSISRKHTFFVRFDSFGIDSFVSDGFAGDGSGKVYSVVFDSLGLGPSPGIEIMDNSHDAVQLCPKPVRIWKELSPKGAFMGYHCAP
jgi:TonB family protein